MENASQLPNNFSCSYYDKELAKQTHKTNHTDQHNNPVDLCDPFITERLG